MKWPIKAKIMQVCASLPLGQNLYKSIQANFGRLNENPTSRLKIQIEMLRWLNDNNMPVKGRTFFEVGTGHNPVVPIGFFLSGAGKVITVDLYRRIDFSIVTKTLIWIANNRPLVESWYQDLIDSAILNDRLKLIEKLQNSSQEFLQEACIEYLAPADAANTNFPDHSIDYHFSVTVMEHIPPQIIKNIFIEAIRILKKEGLAIHFIDLSDHFQHQDPSISRINFLRYSEAKWLRLAGNQFAYCNRLRTTDFCRILQEVNLTIVKQELVVDETSLELLKAGKFKLAQQFDSYSLEDVCTTDLKIMLKPESMPTSYVKK